MFVYRQIYAAKTKIIETIKRRKLVEFLHNHHCDFCHPLPYYHLQQCQHGNGNYHHKMVQQQRQLDHEGEGSPGKRSAERSSDWSCGSLSGIMVVRGKRVPNAILVVMVLTMGDVLRVAHSHLFATVPKKGRMECYIHQILCVQQTGVCHINFFIFVAELLSLASWQCKNDYSAIF